MTRRSFRPALAALAALAAIPVTPAGAAEYAPGEVIVRFRGEERGREMKLPAGVTVARAVRALRRNGQIRYATPNYIAHASSEPFIPDDPGSLGTPGGWQEKQWNFAAGTGINAPQAWANVRDVGRPGGRGVTVAVLDTGVAYRTRGRYKISPDLDRAQFVRGYDFVSRDPYPHDENGHGTHVASTLAERADNGVGLTGVAFGARIMPLRVLDRNGAGEADDIADALRYAAKHKVPIANLSLEFGSEVVASQIPEIISAVRFADQRGVLVIAASGNERAASVAYPARAGKVLSVGATTEHLCHAEYSNEGKGLDLVAPGGGLDTKLVDDPNCRPEERNGRDIFQLTFTDNVRTFGFPPCYQGTSMAAPHVSGTAALIIASGVLGANPSPRQLEDRLEQTARDLGPPGYDTLYGWGLIDAAAATSATPVARVTAPLPEPPSVPAEECPDRDVTSSE